MKKVIKYVIPSLITFVILGITYYFNNLYPFGTKPLVQVDADYIYIPILYKIWDILHYGENIFYTDLGLGNSIYGSLIIQGSLYSPLNLLLYFVDRDNLVNFMGVFIIIKLCLLSFTSYIYINHKYNKINYFYKILFIILYTFNGFIILNYFNHIWLDIVILLPILAIYLEKLLKNSDHLGYIVILSLCLIISFYFSYFVLIFILFYSFINIHLSNRIDKKEIIFKLGNGTLIAILISTFSSFPLIYQILSSSRFNIEVYTELFSNLSMKSLYLLFSPLLIILSFLLIVKYKNDKKKILGYFILIIIYLIPVIIDPINALLHGGTYWSFPYRYGFITSFILLDASLYYISNYIKDKNDDINLSSKIKYIIIMLLLVAVTYITIKSRSTIIDKGILLSIDNEIIIIAFIIGIIFISYILSILINNKYLKYISISIITVFSIFIFTSFTIYYNKGYFLTTNAKNLYNNIDLKKDGRYKVEYNVYTPYYGLMYNVDAYDNWLHLIPSSVLDVHEKLGYNVIDTRDYSYGGTIFSDYILNLKYVLSNKDRTNDNMYESIDNYDSKYLYKYNYNMSYAIPFYEKPNFEFYNHFDYQNMIYKNLFDKNNNIIEYNEYNSLMNNGFTIKITNPSYLYLDTNDYQDINYLRINDEYFYEFDKYILYLGYYDSDITIEVNSKNDVNINYNLGLIKKEDIMNLSSNIKYDNKNYLINNTENYKYLFIPINNIQGLNVYNNGKKVKTYKYLDNFIYIDLLKGNNNITIKYQQPLFKLGIILSIVGIILLIIHKRINANKIILNIYYYLFNFLTIFVFMYFYIYSLFKYLL